MQYLKNKQYYNDLYDLHTIKECLDWYWSMKDGFEKHRKDKNLKKLTKEEFDKDVLKITSYSVNIITIQRYKRKAETLKEWIERDKKLQDKFDNAEPPDEIFCKECFSRTKVTSKDLLGLSDENSQVLFIFECIKCKKRQSLYEDGSEWVYDPPKCPNCNSPLNTKDRKSTKNILKTVYSCPKCSYKKEDVYDFKKSDEKWKKKEERDKKLLELYRKEFCLDDVEGPKAVVNLDNIMRIADQVKEREQKEKNPVYQKAKLLKKLKIGQLKELLENTIEKEGYQDLAFDKPEMGQYVIVEFSVNDMNQEREEYDSVKVLKKLIKSALENTTWRLMSEGISYRLGILTGRIKAYEREEDIIKIIR